MKRILITIFSVIFTLTSFCQDTKSVTKKFSSTKQISEMYNVLKSDGLTKQGEYVSYFLVTEDEYKKIKKGTLNLESYIKQKGNYKNGKKNGEWVEYSLHYGVKTKGTYDNDKKVGVWLTSKEQGIVYERYDYDNNKKLPPIIKISTSYPRNALGEMLEGTVVVSFQTHKNCSITDIKVTKSLSIECDKTSIEAIKTYSEYYQKYGVDCEEKTEIQEIEFKLQ